MALPILFASERLAYRDFSLDDADACWAMWGDPEVMHFLGGVQEKNVEEMRDVTLVRVTTKYGAIRARGEPYGGFALIEKASGDLVGCGLLKRMPDAEKVDTDDVEIGWHLARRVWGKGYATEAGRTLRDRGFETLDVDRLHVVVDPGNERSLAVARRLGFLHFEDTTKYYGRTLHHHELTRDAWTRARDSR
jgi:ribosomal-protein-alanine N-acetyltransferase